jgi:hypothetical protein
MLVERLGHLHTFIGSGKTPTPDGQNDLELAAQMMNLIAWDLRTRPRLTIGFWFLKPSSRRDYGETHEREYAQWAAATATSTCVDCGIWGKVGCLG